MAKLRSFHHRAVRYLTGDHIEKRDKTWYYPDHNKLLKKAKLLPIEKYIERRRGTLRRYFETNKGELLDQAKKIKRHCYDPNKTLWWEQNCIEKKGLRDFSNFWFAG